MATWKEKAAPGTFRGVPFYIETTETTGGRRAVIHEYPFKTKAYSEDMGQRARAFRLRLYVIADPSIAGDDYIPKKDALLDAFEKEGSGALVLPYDRETRTVQVDGDFSVTENQREGGYAEFSVTFVETTASPVQPTSVVDTIKKAKASADVAMASLKVEFLRKYDPGQLMNGPIDALRAATLSINNVSAQLSLPAQQAALLQQRIVGFTNAVTTLASQPENLFNSFTDMLGMVNEVGALLGIYNTDPGTRPPTTTPNRTQEALNFDEIQALTQRASVINMAEVALDTEFTSYDDALETRTLILDLLDAQADTVSDDVYPSLLQLRADLVSAIPGDGNDLAHLVEYTPSVTTPSLVLAWNLYASVDSEQDLIDRNHVRNPLFVLGGRPLEVLSDGG